MRPRFRLAYSAIACSFLPYCSRLALEKYLERDIVQPTEFIALGSLNGAALVALCLTFELPFVVSGMVLGGISGGIHNQIMQYEAKSTINAASVDDSESKYVDKSFKL